ncbi:cystathionine beta-lyase [Friedmanniella endophytica]|uniref:cysteine-S-conjugate beta-lyase n=1 Tax=Microlunatus kandeliicorticis TaxID=1759536 RepID=A0A7W3IP17_9ACTN|nr:aminotransferase class I/II-fold pyridoxal phosphate-dependent enzyme [Microlunatus kandeliicorticis]MBA8792575.1 cystathionine beta-lyase [Microlunatus kandeliicorticis]
MSVLFDAIDLDQLRGHGSVKWSLYPDAIGAFIAEMDFGTAPVITEALHAAVDAGAFGYLPAALADELGTACADWIATSYGWSVPAERIRPLPDVIKGLEVAIEHYSRPGSKVIVPVPAYMPFLQVPGSLGREILEVPLARVDGEYRFDLDAIDAAFTEGGHLLVLCNPYNPAGRVFRTDELEAVAAVVERHGGRVFADEIHAPLVHPGHRHVPYASLSDVTAAHTITATSASKAWNLPGLKCAQLVLSNDADAAVWEQVGFLAEHGAANLGVIANTVAYREGRGWLEEVLSYLDGNRTALAALLAEHLPEVGYTPPEGTYIGWLDCRALGLDDPATFFRERAGVALTDGAACGSPGFVRMIFATPRPILEQAVRQLAAGYRSR